jgi:hypothetical protein
VKSETELKSELAKAVSISSAKTKIRANRQNILVVKKNAGRWPAIKQG